MMDALNQMKAEIASRLSAIPEPCSIAMGGKHTLASMGLVDAIDISDTGAVTVTLCLTDPGCVHFRSMQRYIADALQGLAWVNTVTVVQTLDKLWTPDRVAG